MTYQPDTSWMGTEQVNHMFDTCHKLAHSYSSGGLNQQESTYTESMTDIACGFDPSPGSIAHGDQMTTVTWDAVLRLPLGTTFDEKDRFKITKRFGQAQASPLTYRLASPAQVGPTCIRVLLHKVSE